MKFLKSNFLKNTGLLFSGSFFAQVIGLAIAPILSRIYTPEDFGGLGLFNSLVAVFVSISGFRYEMAIVVESDKHKAKGITQLAMLLNLAIGAFLMLIVLLFQNEIAQIFNISNAFWLYLTPLMVIMSSLLESLVLWHNRAKRYKKISANRIVTSYSAAAYKTGHPFAFTSGHGLIFGQMLGQGLGLIHLWRKSGLELFKFNTTQLKALASEYKNFPLYSAPAALVNILAVKMPFFLLSYFDGQDATGYLENASKLTYLPMSMLALASGQVFFERIARLKDNKKISASVSHQLVQFLFFLGAIPVCILVVYGKDIIPFILGSEWLESGLYVEVLVLFYFSMFLTNPFASAFETYNKLKVHLAYNLSFLILTTGSLVFGFLYFQSTIDALMVYAITGTVLRVSVLNYFFYLFGKPLIKKSLFGIASLALLIWLLRML